MLLLFLDRPVRATLVYGVLGSFFSAVLAITLLCRLNTKLCPQEAGVDGCRTRSSESPRCCS
ncbi:hypothetical protein HBB16_12930 [Pseudonocardia sp. MCCB 268]|nr:hypothetical protein [Pseudonocardia cytotoxica]